MDNLDELTSKIEKLIEYEKSTNPDIKFLNPSHAKLIAQIVSNYNLKSSEEPSPEAEMIFLGAPTGAGKDTLVRKLMVDNPDKDFVILNMDIFRHYHNEISGNQEPISDKDFARTTNQTSYELYYIIQELILQEFPGTNVIVTGTMKDLEWVKEIVTRYKNNNKTNYSVSLATLAVPTNESAFSIFERYLNMVNTRENSETPLRYTDLQYHNDTIKEFISNVRFFEDDLHQNPNNSFFKGIKVYRRNKDIFDLSEDTLVYDSEHPDPEKCASAHLHSIMYSPYSITPNRISELLDLVKNNAEYLKSQDVYKDILTGLEKTLPELNRNSEGISK